LQGAQSACPVIQGVRTPRVSIGEKPLGKPSWAAPKKAGRLGQRWSLGGFAEGPEYGGF
jgi:hypothetical protein